MTMADYCSLLEFELDRLFTVTGLPPGARNLVSMVFVLFVSTVQQCHPTAARSATTPPQRANNC